MKSTNFSSPSRSLPVPRRYGQVYLSNRDIARMEARLIDPSVHKTVLEIGPGHGELTYYLLKSGLLVTCVESDHRNVDSLELKFRSYIESGSLNVKKGSILDIHEGSYDAIIGNIPYHITSEIVFHLSKFTFRIAILMVQKEVAARMIAKPGSKEYSRLSVNCQLKYKCSIIRYVSRRNFSPVPDVDSAIVMLNPLMPEMDKPHNLEHVINRAFSMRRKKISTIFGKDLHEYGDKRPQDLSPGDFLELSRLLLA